MNLFDTVVGGEIEPLKIANFGFDFYEFLSLVVLMGVNETSVLAQLPYLLIILHFLSYSLHFLIFLGFIDCLFEQFSLNYSLQSIGLDLVIKPFL